MALLFLWEGVEDARLQFGRIREDRKAFMQAREELDRLSSEARVSRQDLASQEKREEAMESFHHNNQALFADVHFLLISLDKIDLFSKMLTDCLGGKTNRIRQDYSRSLKEYNDFRNHLEHVDQRIKNGVTDLDLGSLVGDRFRFKGKPFDIGPAREREVEGIFSEILAACEATSTS